MSDSAEWTWVYFCIQVTELLNDNAMHLMDIIAPQAYRMFDLQDLSNVEPHVIVGLSNSTAIIVVGLRVNINAWEDILTASVITNWQQAIAPSIATIDFLEVRQSYDGFMDDVVVWVCRAARSMTSVAERGWPHFD